jgi:hypothetical protein
MSAQMFKKSALRARNEDRDQPASPSFEAGPRAEELANTVRSHEMLDTPEAYAKVINTLWQEASRKFLSIGEHLLQAHAHWQHGEKMKRLEGLLPFSYQVGNKLMRVAQAVRENRLHRDQLPAHYPTAYALTTLTLEELHEAERRSLVRPNVQRREIEDFVREMRRRDTSGHNSALARERTRLAAQMERIKARLREIDDELGTALLEGAAVDQEAHIESAEK